MKSIIILLITILTTWCSFGQGIKKENNPCSCSETITIKYPNVAEEDELEGTVMVEYEIDSMCVASNPKIIQSLGPEFDKEALRVINIMIVNNNKCNLRCHFNVCKEEKIKFPLTFKKPDSD